MTDRARDAALALVRGKIARASEIVPLAGKIPSLDGSPLHEWQKHVTSQRDLLHPAVTGVGIRLGRIVDVDCDCDEAIERAARVLPRTTTFGRPSKGRRAHYLYEPVGRVETRQIRDPHTRKTVVELRGYSREGAAALQTMAPGSVHPDTGEVVALLDEDGVAPTRIDAESLLALVIDLGVSVLTDRHGPQDDRVKALAARLRGDDETMSFGPPSATQNARERAAAYVDRMDPAISGSGGRGATFRVCLVLARGFSLPADDAWPILKAYNSRAQPPWRDHELRAKLLYAQRHGDMPFGALLPDRPRD